MSEFDFWSMTVGEILRFINGALFREERQLKTQARLNHSLALTIVSGIGASFNNQPFPSIYEIYPDLFEEEQKQENINKSVANFMAFANSFNRKFKEKQNDSRRVKSNN